MHPNEMLVRRWFQEVWNERRLETADEILCEGCAATDLRSGAGRSREEMKQLVAELQQAIPDITFTVEEVLAADDRVALRRRARGAAAGPDGPLPVDIGGLSIAHIEDGRATRIWDAWDQLGLLQQLGHIRASWTRRRCCDASGLKTPTRHGEPRRGVAIPAARSLDGHVGFASSP